MANPQGFTVFNGQLYFFAATAAAGSEPWRTDGDAANIPADINPGAADRDLGMDEYLDEGFHAALDAVAAIVPGQRVQQLALLVGQVGEQGVGQQVDDVPQAVQGPRFVGDQRHERPVDVVEHVVDDLVLLLEPVDHRAGVGVLRSQVREDRGVLERVVTGDDAAVRLAVRPERPVVLAHRHGVDR